VAVECRLVAEESPTAGARFVEDALAAIGRERRETKREEVALRNVKANTVAVVGCYRFTRAGRRPRCVCDENAYLKLSRGGRHSKLMLRRAVQGSG